MKTNIKVGVIITDNAQNKILLIKEKIKKNNQPLWNIIKGTYDRNTEENIFETAKRECREEASVEVILKNAIGCYIHKKRNKTTIQFNFLAKIMKGKPAVPDINEQNGRNENIIEIRWFNKNKILNMPTSDFVAPKIYNMLIDWIKSGKKFPLNIYKQL